MGLQPILSNVWKMPWSSSDCLIERTTDEAAKAKFEDIVLSLQFQEVGKLPNYDKQIIKKLIGPSLIKKHI